MEIQVEEATTYYITMDKHDFEAVQKMVTIWYDSLANGVRPNVIEFKILDAFKVGY